MSAMRIDLADDGSDFEQRAAAWVHAFPVGDVRRELERLESERAALTTEIDRLRRRLALWASIDSGVRRDGTGSAAVDVAPSKRDAILAVLHEEAGPMRLRDIREELIRRRWLEPSKRAIHALEVAATTMAARHEIERVRKGVYRASRRRPT